MSSWVEPRHEFPVTAISCWSADERLRPSLVGAVRAPLGDAGRVPPEDARPPMSARPSFGERTEFASWPEGPRVTIAAADLRELVWLGERADRAGLAGKCDEHLTDDWCRVCTALQNADRILADADMQPPIDEDDTPEDVARFLAEREPLERDR